MIEGLIDNEVLPGNLRKDTIERTDDIPLFVEEMTKALLEAGAESAARQRLRPFRLQRWQSPRACTLPSWHGSIGSGRPAKEVAQIGAAIGHEFPMLCMGRSWGSQSWSSIQLSAGSLQPVCHFDSWAVAI